MKKILLLIPVAITALSLYPGEGNEPAATVEVKKKGRQYNLYRNGEPYFIKGAGGYKNFERLKDCGGNSVRLWSTVGAKEYLDKAQALGLTVTLGLDMGHERRGF